jgi:hypothetical protein
MDAAYMNERLKLEIQQGGLKVHLWASWAK